MNERRRKKNLQLGNQLDFEFAQMMQHAQSSLTMMRILRVRAHTANTVFSPSPSLSQSSRFAKCLVSDIQPSSFKVKPTSDDASAARSDARYPNYV